MTHALIIDENLLVSRTIQACLEELGFRSFDQTWTEEQAVAAASLHVPDLVVIGDGVETGSPIRAAQRISDAFDVPILLVSCNPVRTREQLSEDIVFMGPFPLHELNKAVDIARDGLMTRQVGLPDPAAHH